jgi:uncharacterized protein (DUF1330 family)
MSLPAPGFLVIKAFCPHAAFTRFAAELPGLGAHAGTPLLLAPLHQVSALEPGSVPAHIAVLEYVDADERDHGWQAIEPMARAAGLFDGRAPIVLAMAGIPPEGLGDLIPTAANVPVSPAFQPPAFLLIEGSATDQQRMDRYRDIILPMMRERSSYYVAFELGGNVKVLSGEWSEAIFAISWWPSMGHALDFWLARRYQQDAIPLRLDIGHFDVLAATGSAA